MSEIKVASRYAKSLIDLAKEQSSLDAVKNDIVLLNEVISKNNELATLLKNPIITLDKKQAILNGLFQGKMSNITLLFFKIIVQKGRAPLMHDIAKSFIAQYNTINAIVVAEVTSANELNEQSKKEITSIVQNSFNAKVVQIETKINPSLIGGFIIKVNDQQYDASISNRFVKLRKELGVATN